MPAGTCAPRRRMKALPHPLSPDMRLLTLRDLVWLTGSLAIVIAPHALRAPWWLTLLTLCLYGWRFYCTLNRSPLPARWLTLAVAFVAMLLVWMEYRTLFDAMALRAAFEAEPPPLPLRYWRGPVLWDFAGRTWSTEGVYPVRYEPPPNPRGVYRYSVVLEAHNHPWLFALETAVSLPAASRMSFDGQVLANAPVRSRLRYEMASAIAPGQAREESRGLLARALRLPAGYNRRAVALAQEWRAAGGSDANVLARALDFLRKGRFTYTLEPPLLGADPVDEFLFETKAGFCEHFASAFTVLMRAAGIPARVVTGYQGGDLNPVDQIITVRQSDAHAWTEVFLPGRGWVRIDPTAAAMPQRVNDGLARALPQMEGLPLMLRPDMAWLRAARYQWEALAHKWNVWVLGYSPERQRDLMLALGMRDADWQKLTALLFTFLGLMTIGLLVWSLRRLARPDPVQKAWQAFCGKLAARGIARAPHEGPRDYSARAARALPASRAAILRIGALYISLRYGAGVSAPAAARLRRLVRELRLA